MVELKLLGEFRVQIDGRAVELRSRKARALLAFLAMHPRGATREQLAGLLWGDMGEARARANLRQAISNIRDVLGEDFVRGDDERVQLSELVVDARDVLALAASSDSTSWSRVVAMYGGELLADLVVDEAVFVEWRTAEARATARAVFGVFARLVAALRAQADVAGAEAVLRRWLELDSTCATAQRALAELDAENRRALAPLPLLSKPTIAILPFEDLSGGGETWLSDGIAEDIVVALSKFDRLRVIARQSSFVFRDRRLDVREIGRALGVHYVLTGSVRRADDRLRISVQLVDAGTGATSWAHRYESHAGDIFALEDEITRVIVATLAERVESEQVAKVVRQPTAILAAYDWLLRAKAHHHRYTREDNALAQDCLVNALALDADFALAHAWAACVIMQAHHMMPDPALLPRAREHLRRAQILETNESECHRILASAHLFNRRFEEAEEHQRRALELNPNDDRILSQMGELLTYFGRPDEALPWIELSIRLNPFLSDTTCYDHGRALYQLGRLEEARVAFRRIRAPRAAHHAYQAAIATRLGDAAAARRHLLDARRLASASAFAPDAFVRSLPFRYAREAERLLADLSVISV